MRKNIKNKIWEIYTLIDPISNIPRYVGFTINPKRRLWRHIYDAKTKVSDTYKDRWICSLLNNNLLPLYKTLECGSGDNWKLREIFWISLYKEFGFNLTNLTLGGDGQLGVSPSEETRKKIGLKHKNKIVSLETRKKMSKHKVGIPLSEEHGYKIGLANKNRIISQETKEKLSHSKKKENISENTLRLRSEARRKIIFCTETKRIFKSMSEFSRFLKVSIKKTFKIFDNDIGVYQGIKYYYINKDKLLNKEYSGGKI